jgi:hypothetical protein
MAIFLITTGLLCIWISTVGSARTRDRYSSIFFGAAIGLLYSGVSKLMTVGQTKLSPALDIAVAVLTAIIVMSAQSLILQHKERR